MDKLFEDITEILVKTLYSALYGVDETVKQTWEEAVSLFQNDPKFHAVVRTQVALIMKAVERHQLTNE